MRPAVRFLCVLLLLQTLLSCQTSKMASKDGDVVVQTEALC